MTNPPVSGVYLIRCAASDEIYVGQSRNIERRWRSHISCLSKGNGCPKMQQAWNKHGPFSFSWSVLHECPYSFYRDVELWEIFWILVLSPTLNGAWPTCNSLFAVAGLWFKKTGSIPAIALDVYASAIGCSKAELQQPFGAVRDPKWAYVPGLSLNGDLLKRISSEFPFSHNLLRYVPGCTRR